MNTHIKGDIAVACCIKLLTINEYVIFKSLSEYLPYDILVTKDHTSFKRIQIKYSSMKEGIFNLRLRNIHTNGSGVQHKQVDLSKIDWFMVYCPETDLVYTIPSNEVKEGATEMTFRVEAPKNGQVKGIRFAKDYETLPKELQC